MKKIISKFLVAICCIALLISCFVLIGKNGQTKTLALTSEYPTEEQYTEKDTLLKVNGLENGKTIQNFSAEVNASEYGTAFDELAEVIPAQYLNAPVPEATYQHNGKEYGFYVASETVAGNVFFDVLLIDFIYEFDDDETHSDAEHKIRIKPILQQSFLRTAKAEGGYTWIKSDALRYTYYVSNPRFLVEIQNENSLNSEDAGYTKADDEGLIIIQSRVNYGKVKYSDLIDLAHELGSFDGKLLLDSFITCLDAIAYGIPSVLTAILQESNVLYESSKEITVETNCKFNIFTQQSKYTQRENNELQYYSRSAGFTPNPDHEIVLSADSGSYAEFITLLNDSGHRSRFMQICEFDIMRRVKGYGNMESVTQDLKFHKQSVLYENSSPHFEISRENFDNSNTYLYLLPGGRQTVEFSPMYTGDYTFTLPNNLQLSINGVNYGLTSDGKCTVRLNQVTSGSPYQIVITNNTNNKVISTLNCKLKDLDGSVNIAANNHCLLGYNSVGGLKQVKVDNNCTIDILSSGLVKLKELTQNNCYFNFSEGQKYYFLVKNNGGSAVNATVSIQDPEFYDVSEDYTATVSGELYVSYNLQPGTYGFEYSTDANFSGCLQSGIFVDETYYVETEKSCRVIHLSQPQCVNFKFTGTGTVSFTLYNTSVDWAWEVTAESGIRFEGTNNLYIKRGTTATVKFRVGTTYYFVQKTDDYVGWSYNSSTFKLTIDRTCALANDIGDNIQSLVAIYDEGKTLQTLQIYVISDITYVNFVSFSDDKGYGIAYGIISNNPNDKIIIKLDIPDVIDSYDESVIGIAGTVGSIYLNKISRQPNAPKHYTATILEIKIGGATVFSSQDPDNVDHIRINNVFYISTLFGEGNGSVDHPFVIKNYAQLKNISAYSTTNSNFKITEDIQATGYWTPIPMFNGKINGRQHYIYDLKIAVGNGSSMFYGLFGQLNGSVSNLNFYNANVSSTATYSEERVYVGLIAGMFRRGSISDCTVSGTVNIDVRIYNSKVGGIVGYNASGISNARVSNINFSVSGYAGGIAGQNECNIINCRSENIRMNYYWDTDNGRIGGIVGYNESRGLVYKCKSSGMIYWTSPRKGAEIYPAMGYIIGYNAKDAACNDCSSTMENVISYHTRKIFGPYDQSGWCFKFDNGNIGWQES